MDDWGTDGPILGPYEFLHTTYGHLLKMGKPAGKVDELFLYEDMVYYDGMYYGDWSVFDAEVFEKSKFQIAAFMQDKANLPKKREKNNLKNGGLI